MKIAQIYKLVASEDNIKNAAPGQFVHTRNVDDEVIGFIGSCLEGVDGIHYLTIILFEPREVPENAIIIEESVHDDTIQLLLHGALEQNPAMYDEWNEAANS